MLSEEDLNPYLVSDERLALFEEPEKIIEQIEEGDTLQDVLGFTDEVMLEFYEVAAALYDAEEYEDALAAFFFLSTVNGLIPEFWTALGATQERLLKRSEAVQSYTVAAILRETDITSYQQAIDCCLESAFPDRAIDLLELAQAISEDEDVATEEFREQVVALQLYLETKRGGE